LRETKNEIEIQIGTMHIEPSIVAQGLELGPLRVQAMMRKGEITSLCECGVMRMRGALSADILPQEPTFSPHSRRHWNRPPALDRRRSSQD
jgi:Family of unknown function (DUF6522)